MMAEKVIKRNKDNYSMHYPEKFDRYSPEQNKRKTVAERSKSPVPKKKQYELDASKINPHILMRAVDRQLKMSK